MKNNTHAKESSHKEKDSNGGAASSAVAGLVIGGLAGAGAALLFAPQSGKETREQIQQKTIEIRDRTAETVEEAVSQVKAKTQQITTNLQGKAEDLQHQSKEVIADQLDRVSAAADAGKAALTHEQ
jgi:gas vesicle protein